MLPQFNSRESTTNLMRLLWEKPRMGYQIETSMNVHDSEILEDPLPPKKDPGSFTLPCYTNNICFEKDLADLGASVNVMPYSTFTNLGLDELAPTKLIIELANRTITRRKGIAENVLVGIDKFVFPIDFIVLDMPEDIEVPLILRRPFLSTAHAKIDVSLDHVYGDYIELNDLNKPLELKINQVEDLGPTIEDGEVTNEPMEEIVKTRNDDNEVSIGIVEYPSFCDYDKKIHINGAYNLQFSCMIVVENMDAYRNDGMGEVIVKKPFSWMTNAISALASRVGKTMVMDDVITTMCKNRVEKVRELVDDFIRQKRDPANAEMLKWNIDMVAYYKQRKEKLVNKGKVSYVLIKQIIEVDDDSSMAQCLEGDEKRGMDEGVLVGS
nr:hypothetical protein [Tanacetum cinerariifolium]